MDVKKFPTERLQAMLLFLNNPGKTFTSQDITEEVGIKQHTGSGKIAGGILSSIFRAKINGKDLIVPLEPEIGTRRMKWVLNTIDVDEKTRIQQIKQVNEVIARRNKLLNK